MNWEPGFHWKEMEGKANAFLGASMRSKEVAIVLWEDHVVPPAVMWQWQVLHKSQIRASGGEATQALGTIAAQKAYSRYVGSLKSDVPDTPPPRALKYIWAPARGASYGDGQGVGRVPRDRSVRMRVSRCAEKSDMSLWSFIVTRGPEKIASGYRGNKREAVFAAEQAYDESL